MREMLYASVRVEAILNWGWNIEIPLIKATKRVAYFSFDLRKFSILLEWRDERLKREAGSTLNMRS